MNTVAGVIYDSYPSTIHALRYPPLPSMKKSTTVEYKDKNQSSKSTATILECLFVFLHSGFPFWLLLFATVLFPYGITCNVVSPKITADIQMC